MDPRIARSRQAVIDAGVELIADRGAGAFSIDAVAARSGVAKTTIYRHWPTRRELLRDVFDAFDAEPPTPDTGSLRGDIRALLQELRRDLAEADWPKSLTAVVAEAEHDRDLADAHVRHVRVEMRAYGQVLRRAQERGELADGVDLDLVAEHLVGAQFFRRLVLHGTNTTREVDRLVDFILSGIQKEAR